MPWIWRHLSVDGQALKSYFPLGVYFKVSIRLEKKVQIAVKQASPPPGVLNNKEEYCKVL